MAKIRVLVVDDSALIRSLVTRLLSLDPDIEVVGEAEDPFVARELIKKLNPDVLTLDVEMPKMDGITFLRNLMRLRPMPVIMLSTLTTQGADVTLDALAIGAVDFIAKPSADVLLAKQDSFSERLITKVKQAAGVDQNSVKRHQLMTSKSSQASLSYRGGQQVEQLIAIGASTGGTEAIQTVLQALPSNTPPVVITQHIPPTFSERFANRLNNKCQIAVQEAKHGQKLMVGNAYIAPGGMHLRIAKKGSNYFCQLDDGPEVKRHRPSVDVLFQSLVPTATNTQALLLTGMGDDGAEGLLALKKAGARTVIQSKNSSLIWGMPGSAAKIDAHTDEIDLANIAESVLQHANLAVR